MATGKKRVSVDTDAGVARQVEIYCIYIVETLRDGMAVCIPGVF